jgi:hypothetical protein
MTTYTKQLYFIVVFAVLEISCSRAQSTPANNELAATVTWDLQGESNKPEWNVYGNEFIHDMMHLLSKNKRECTDRQLIEKASDEDSYVVHFTTKTQAIPEYVYTYMVGLNQTGTNYVGLIEVSSKGSRKYYYDDCHFCVQVYLQNNGEEHGIHYGDYVPGTAVAAKVPVDVIKVTIFDGPTVSGSKSIDEFSIIEPADVAKYFKLLNENPLDSNGSKGKQPGSESLVMTVTYQGAFYYVAVDDRYIIMNDKSGKGVYRLNKNHMEKLLREYVSSHPSARTKMK